MRFSLQDYQACIRSGSVRPPRLFRQYSSINRQTFKKVEREYKKRKHTVKKAFHALERRLDQQYFLSSFNLQFHALRFSRQAFPSYRFILPDVMANDWLGMVGWHKSHHRDHIVHQPLVGYIVLKLLDEGTTQGPHFEVAGRSLLDHCVDQVISSERTQYLRQHLLRLGEPEDSPWVTRGHPAHRTLWKGLIRQTAYLAAAFHDMGYPWQYMRQLKDMVDHAQSAAVTPNGKPSDIVDQFGQRLLFYPLNGYGSSPRSDSVAQREWLTSLVKASLNGTHGLPGALAFLFMNDAVREFPENPAYRISQFCVEWAAVAILMHDMCKIYWGDDNRSDPQYPHLRLRFDVDPLSCIVTLADLLEDFCRPSAEFTPGPRDVSVEYQAHCLETKLECNEHSAIISYLFSDSREAAKKAVFVPEEQFKHFDSRHGYVDLSALGIDHVEMRADLAPPMLLDSSPTPAIQPRRQLASDANGSASRIPVPTRQPLSTNIVLAPSGLISPKPTNGATGL